MKPLNIHDAKGEFFSVLGKTGRSQVATMTLSPGKDSGPEEIHDGDQIVFVVEGTARVEINKETHEMHAGDVVIIPERAQHHIYNTGEGDLFFLNVYTPPQY